MKICEGIFKGNLLFISIMPQETSMFYFEPIGRISGVIAMYPVYKHFLGRFQRGLSPVKGGLDAIYD